MTTTCNLSKNIVGPFSQTLFLGCSVVDFTSNLGWGADSSTLSVTLVEDSSSHPEGSRLQTNFYNKLKELSKTNDQLFEGDSLKSTNNKKIKKYSLKNIRITCRKSVPKKPPTKKTAKPGAKK